jgi:hypothetical protein
MATARYRIDPASPSYCIKVSGLVAARALRASEDLGCTPTASWSERLNALSELALEARRVGKEGAKKKGARK